MVWEEVWIIGSGWLTLRIHRIVEALISIIPVGIVLLSLWTSNLLPQIVSRLILIRFSIRGTVSILSSIFLHWLFCCLLSRTISIKLDARKMWNLESAAPANSVKEKMIPTHSTQHTAQSRAGLVDIADCWYRTSNPKFFNRIQENYWKIEKISKKNFELSLGWRGTWRNTWSSNPGNKHVSYRKYGRASVGFSIFHSDPDKNVNSSTSRVDLLLLLVSWSTSFKKFETYQIWCSKKVL